MKLRNKKTGEIVQDFDGFTTFTNEWSSVKNLMFNSIAELNEKYEDYTPAEPLIKDEKIRKAVRAWAEANGIPKNIKLEVFEYLGTGLTAVQYDYKAKTKPYNRCVQFEYISSDEIYDSQNDRKYTIAELCGEEEE